MKHSFLPGVVLIAGLAAGTASAQDWTGFYAGVSLNSANGNFDIVSFPFPLGGSDGASLGIYAGYNYQMPSNVVFGGELSFTDMTIPAGVGLPLSSEDLTQFRGRLGYAMDNVMPYFALGYATTEVFGPSTPAGNSTSATSFGLGAEFAFGSNAVLRAEYTKADFGDISSTLAAPPGTIDLDIEMITVGLGWKF
jgi:outer membrane immunogenic protein